MAIPRITPEVIEEFGLVSAPDILTGTPRENKARFDRLIREKIAGSVNQVLDAWDAYTVLEEYSASKQYAEFNKVTYLGSTYQCLKASKGNLPTSTTYWKLLAVKGADGTGIGDMLASIYDPRNQKKDIFTAIDTNMTTSQQACITLGTTTGTASALTLSCPITLQAGGQIRFKTNVALTLPTTLKVGSLSAMPLLMPFRGKTTVPSGSWLGAVYTGSNYSVFSDNSITPASQSLTWFDLPTVLGTWPVTPKYTKVNGMVFLMGRVQAGATTNTLHATLPAGYRPGVTFTTQSFSNVNSNMNVCAEIRTDGGIWTFTVSGNSSSTNFSVMFPAEN